MRALPPAFHQAIASSSAATLHELAYEADRVMPSCMASAGPLTTLQAEAEVVLLLTKRSGFLPQELKVDMQVPSAHSAKKEKRFLEEDASFNRPAPVMSEDEN
ncbi:hypothetical protein CAPTEDRAFT_195473 [Capitella teleta]|uniref:Uncharacterized protein n=1 Tax=Capitella teleta TaxID=283909 RepID=R7TEV0_CAPTE|nr:hypothetical protein CAPTEDRAFT_195473 [Capitella teleta]|eukprot:ELT92254.1 hypothetical protein CAPTEDRAFT_195473 [Capitella teleta]